jgi:hypothetical protein
VSFHLGNGDGLPQRPTGIVVVQHLGGRLRHVRPAFLKLPTSSFFLVATLITGNPLPRYNLRIRTM